MTFQADRTRLLLKAGKQKAEELLPEAFRLWFDNHDTGIQMTIVTASKPTLPVWKGSIWHSHIYEFNDNGKISGLQPDFVFAHDIIEAYFAALQVYVQEAETRQRDATKQREIEESRTRDSSVDETRRKLGIK